MLNDYAIYKPFVANRLKAIKEMTKVEDWFYISSNDNFPADSASRGRDLKDFIGDRRWWEGPEFLTIPKFDYAKMDIKNIQLSREIRAAEDGEKKASIPHFSNHIFHEIQRQTKPGYQCQTH